MWQTLIVPWCDPQERNLDWFPRMRAMSLVSSDSEGEQNELRNLQEKLESTMKLVTNLSGQLSELKDQVRSNGQHRAPASPSGFCSSTLLQTPGRAFPEYLVVREEVNKPDVPPEPPCSS